MRFTKYLPIAKVEEQADGSLRVYGIVTAEKPDRENEICDYEKTKPFYQLRCDEMAKITGAVEGMETSIMPLREMHQLNAVGKGISINFDDAGKTIRMGFEVVAPDTVKKVKKGVLPCFSQGGDYAEKWIDKSNPEYTRYAADPGEVSLVDRGSLPGAVIESIKGRTFQLVKADGSMELRKFEEPAPQPKITEADANLIAAVLRKQLEDGVALKKINGKEFAASAFAYVGDITEPATWHCLISDANYAKASLAFFTQTAGIADNKKEQVRKKIVAACKGFNVDISAETEKISRAIEFMQGRAFQKSMYDVAQLAQVTETIQWLQSSSCFEREYEGDASAQPEKLEALLASAIECLRSMVEEESNELMQHAAAISGRGEKAMTQEELQKAATDLLAKRKSVSDHLNSMSEAHKAHKDKMHKAHQDFHDSQQESIGKCHKALGGEGEGDITAPAGGGESGRKEAAAGGSMEFNLELVGKVDGVDVYKKVEKKAVSSGAAFDQKAFMDELLTKLDERVDEKLGTAINKMTESLFDVDLSKGAPAPAAGVGDRNDVARKFSVTAVSKADDATGAQPAARANGGIDEDNPATWTQEYKTQILQRATAGDMKARLQLNKLKRPMSAQESVEAMQHISDGRSGGSRG